MTRNDILYDPQKKDLVFVRTETIVAWNVVNTIVNSYSYTPEMGMDLDIQSFNIRINENDIRESSSVNTVLRADITTQLAKFGLGLDEFKITIKNDIMELDMSVSRISEVTKDEL